MQGWLTEGDVLCRENPLLHKPKAINHVTDDRGRNTEQDLDASWHHLGCVFI